MSLLKRLGVSSSTRMASFTCHNLVSVVLLTLRYSQHLLLLYLVTLLGPVTLVALPTSMLPFFRLPRNLPTARPLAAPIIGLVLHAQRSCQDAPHVPQITHVSILAGVCISFGNNPVKSVAFAGAWNGTMDTLANEGEGDQFAFYACSSRQGASGKRSRLLSICTMLSCA